MNALIIPNRLSKESKTTQEENAQYSSLKLTLNEVIKDNFNTRNTAKKNNAFPHCMQKLSLSVLGKCLIMSNSTLFVNGSIHQGHERFSDISRGRQCSFASFPALLFA